MCRVLGTVPFIQGTSCSEVPYDLRSGSWLARANWNK